MTSKSGSYPEQHFNRSNLVSYFLPKLVSSLTPCRKLEMGFRLRKKNGMEARVQGRRGTSDVRCSKRKPSRPCGNTPSPGLEQRNLIEIPASLVTMV